MSRYRSYVSWVFIIFVLMSWLLRLPVVGATLRSLLRHLTPMSGRGLVGAMCGIVPVSTARRALLRQAIFPVHANLAVVGSAARVISGCSGEASQCLGIRDLLPKRMIFGNMTAQEETGHGWLGAARRIKLGRTGPWALPPLLTPQGLEKRQPVGLIVPEISGCLAE